MCVAGGWLVASSSPAHLPPIRHYSLTTVAPSGPHRPDMAPTGPTQSYLPAGTGGQESAGRVQDKDT